MKFGLYRLSTGLFLLDLTHNGTFDAGDRAVVLAAPNSVSFILQAAATARD